MSIERQRIAKAADILGMESADLEKVLHAAKTGQPVELSQDEIMLAKQNAYLEQYRARGLEFMLAATMIYQRAWETALSTMRESGEVEKLKIALEDIAALADRAFGTHHDFTARCGDRAKAALAILTETTKIEGQLS